MVLQSSQQLPGLTVEWIDVESAMQKVQCLHRITMPRSNDGHDVETANVGRILRKRELGNCSSTIQVTDRQTASRTQSLGRRRR